MFISIFIAYLQVEFINIYIKMEKGKADVKNSYIAFPSDGYTFFVFSFITKIANFIHDIYITYRKFKHIIQISFN